MNDLIPSVRTTGAVEYHGLDIFGPGIDPVEVRRRIMVFQKPNPFPKSIRTTWPSAPASTAIAATSAR